MMFEKTTYVDGFPIKIKIAKIIEYPFHYHQDVEIVYVLKGEIRLKDVSTYYTLKEGDLFTVNGHEVHGLFCTNEDNVVAIVQISNRFFTQYFPELNKACFMTYVRDEKKDKLDELRRIILRILISYYSKSFNFREVCVDKMIELIGYLNRYFNLFAFDDQVIVDFQSDNPIIIERVSRIINYIYENHASRISLKDIAEIEHMSTYYLSHYFKTNIGLNFLEFLCFARVEMSEIPLLETDKPISEISKDVGFSATSYYVKFFRKWFGCTPFEHRDRFASHVLSSGRLPVIDILSNNDAVNLIKSRLSAAIDQDNSLSLISRRNMTVSIDPLVKPVKNFNPQVETTITYKDYKLLGERIFGLLNELNVSKIVLSFGRYDSEAEISLIRNRLSFMGYDVSLAYDAEKTFSVSAGYDTVAYSIQTVKKAFDSKGQILKCRLIDSVASDGSILSGFPACMTHNLLKKPVFHAIKLLSNIKGELLYCGKHYYVVKKKYDGRESYILVLLNYNDDINHLCTRNATVYDASDTINSYNDELHIDFKIPILNGKYTIIKYALFNSNSIFYHLSQLGFHDVPLSSEQWLHLLNTLPETQIIVEEADNNILNISSIMHGAGIVVMLVEDFNNDRMNGEPIKT